MAKIILFLLMLFISLPAYAGFQDIQQNQPLRWASVSTATTTLIKSGPTYLHTMVITGGTAGTIQLFDSLTGTGGAIVANYSSTNTPNTYTFDVGLTSGCTVVTGGATNITFSFL